MPKQVPNNRAIQSPEPLASEPAPAQVTVRANYPLSEDGYRPPGATWSTTAARAAALGDHVTVVGP